MVPLLPPKNENMSSTEHRKANPRAKARPRTRPESAGVTREPKDVQANVEAQVCENTDRELWREREGDYYADSIFVTKEGAIGINCGGTVYVKSLKAWHDLASYEES
jgi:hypothetical protein